MFSPGSQMGTVKLLLVSLRYKSLRFSLLRAFQTQSFQMFLSVDTHLLTVGSFLVCLSECFFLSRCVSFLRAEGAWRNVISSCITNFYAYAWNTIVIYSLCYRRLRFSKKLHSRLQNQFYIAFTLHSSLLPTLLFLIFSARTCQAFFLYEYSFIILNEVLACNNQFENKGYQFSSTDKYYYFSQILVSKVLEET